VKVQQPKPWGVIAGSAALGVALVALLVYAVMNQGGGVSELVRDPDNAIEGVTVADEEALGRDHVAGAVEYEQLPPPGGDHNGVPQSCDVYTEPIANEHAVHSLEHGAVWVTYNDDASEDDVAALEDEVRGDPYRLMSPLPSRRAPSCSPPGAHPRGGQRRRRARRPVPAGLHERPADAERGAACVGVTTTGPLQAAPTDTPTMPAASPSAAPSAAPSAVPSAPASPAAQ
jgi:hypothetical protein